MIVHGLVRSFYSSHSLHATTRVLPINPYGVVPERRDEPSSRDGTNAKVHAHQGRDLSSVSITDGLTSAVRLEEGSTSIRGHARPIILCGEVHFRSLLVAWYKKSVEVVVKCALELLDGISTRERGRGQPLYVSQPPVTFHHTISPIPWGVTQHHLARHNHTHTDTQGMPRNIISLQPRVRLSAPVFQISSKNWGQYQTARVLSACQSHRLPLADDSHTVTRILESPDGGAIL